ncbi:hypothetical protein T11_16009 [Trichinella zimbabwensis]|uniref:Secreted protein n=1 Tax=Trichinella zimbabwensis TaxID=268475 RepID=A0A0V1I838_9BILA|nr:hypothetical protein T11_16009 [Trichinella zimbabwensis]
MLCLFYLLNTLDGLSLVYTHSTLNTISPFLQRIVEPCLRNFVAFRYDNIQLEKQQNIYAIFDFKKQKKLPPKKQ